MKDYRLNFRHYRNFTCPDSLFDLSLNGPMIRPDEEAPVPWDVGIEVKEGILRLSGGAGPSGFGTCEVTLPAKQSDYYFIYLELEEENVSQVRRLLDEQDVYLVE
jgi:hypothetical protein